MNVLLINMPIRVAAAPNILPTGIGLLASLLESQGHMCNVLDLNVIRPEISISHLVNLINSDSNTYDLVGLSGMITTLRWQKIVADQVRRRWPECCLVSGGGLASDFGTTLFEWIPYLNVVVIGEGESHMSMIASDCQTLKGTQTVLGPDIVLDLDNVPEVAWEKFDMETYLSNAIWGIGASNSSWTPFEMNRSINLISSRGCPYNCNFCDRHTTGGRNYRLCSTKRLMQDVEEVLDRFHVDFIGFVDDNFISDKKRLEEFLPLIKGKSINWGCHGRLNEINDDIALQLREAGCVYIGFGGESADPYMLKRMNKKNQVDQMSLAVKACKAAGITPNCTWIMGYPGETRESLRRTAQFIIEHNLSQKSMFVATAYPGTHFFEEVNDKILSVYDSLESYVLDLDDATKVLSHKGKLLNYSSMSDAEFLECREYVERGELGLI